MADYSLALNEDQEQIRDWVHEFAESVIRPVAADWDEREEFPWPVVEEAAKIGLYSWDFIANAFGDKTGLTFPIISEELCWGDAGITLAILGTTLGVSGIVGNPWNAAYAESKGGVLMLTKALAAEYRHRGVRVNGIAPGMVATDLSAGFTDFFLITSGTNERQTQSIADEVELRLKQDFGTYPNSVEGKRQGEWILLDYVDFVVHIFSARAREL